VSPKSHPFWSKKENWLGNADVAVAAATAIVVVACVLMCMSASDNNSLKAAACFALPKSVCLLNCSLCLSASHPCYSLSMTSRPVGPHVVSCPWHVGQHLASIFCIIKLPAFYITGPFVGLKALMCFMSIVVERIALWCVFWFEMADIFHGKCSASPALGGGNSLLFEYFILPHRMFIHSS
jgi:hypothetical protein